MQDVVALNMLERIIAGEPACCQELSINIDTGALAARRILARLRADEPAQALPAAVAVSG